MIRQFLETLLADSLLGPYEWLCGLVVCCCEESIDGILQLLDRWKEARSVTGLQDRFQRSKRRHQLLTMRS